MKTIRHILTAIIFAIAAVAANAGALTERFALRFTNSTTFECIGEHLGFIGSGTINADFAPINPVGAAPYFTLRALGFPPEMFTVLFAVARTVGWVSQWREMMEEPANRIGRPRQLYNGAAKREYVPIEKR